MSALKDEMAEVRALVNAALETAAADDVRIVIEGSDQGYTRYARSEVTTAAEVQDQSARVTCAFGQKHATVSTHDVTPDGLVRAVARAEAMARLAPADPEFVRDPGPATPAPVPGAFDAATARPGPEARADAVARAIGDAKKRGLLAAGFLQEGARSISVATKRGFFAQHRQSLCSFTSTVRTADGSGSGWAGLASERRGDLDVPALAARAAELAEASRNTAPLEPGAYAAVLMPEVLAELVPMLLHAMDQRAADEGRSFFSKAAAGDRLGQRLFGDVSLRSDPADPLAPAAPFDEEALLRQRVAWIDHGVALQLQVSRYWAEKTRRKATARPGGAVLGLAGREAQGTEELLAGLRRGLLVTRLWYVRMLEPQTISVTGLTRDGTFLVEGGKIVRPVNNFRFNQSIPELLAAVEQATAPQRTSHHGFACPAVRVRAFHMSSVSEAV